MVNADPAESELQWPSHLLSSRGRGSGFAGPQAQRPLGGQRATRSARTWGLYF